MTTHPKREVNQSQHVEPRGDTSLGSDKGASLRSNNLRKFSDFSRVEGENEKREGRLENRDIFHKRGSTGVSSTEIERIPEPDTLSSGRPPGQPCAILARDLQTSWHFHRGLCHRGISFPKTTPREAPSPSGAFTWFAVSPEAAASTCASDILSIAYPRGDTLGASPGPRARSSGPFEIERWVGLRCTRPCERGLQEVAVNPTRKIVTAGQERDITTRPRRTAAQSLATVDIVRKTQPWTRYATCRQQHGNAATSKRSAWYTTREPKA